ncbi:MAG: WYL domain-containing protein [candidate division KSB1 bacterium]|nr:WYL domain-containing protein [candidate division KSB1 bacterium]MDZ7364249.1 WYL domain-containing protein [candidate division KSB1 bacterium]MDZ7404972.1 WYL domain-containing protein [candidate division KSB1 bacterium]
MQKSIRLLKIVELCSHKRMMTAPRLAQMCGVTERTIYRDLQALGELGVAIAAENGYRVISFHSLPQFHFTHLEQVVLTLALKNLPLHLDKELNRIAGGLLNKLLEQPVESPVIALEAPPAGQLKGNVFARLQKAIEAHQLVTFLKYRKLADEVVSGLTVEPYLLYFRDRAWYLVAWNPQREAHRIYRLDRIDKLRVEKQIFTPRPFNAEEYFRGSFGIVVDAPQRLRARFTGLAKEIVKKDGRFSPEEMREENGALILDKIIKGEILYLRWILGFGGEAEILEPAAMREKAVRMLREGLEKYEA